MPAPSASAVYSIGAVSRLVGVPTATLRAWEERYGVVRPERSEGGQRLYSREQAEQLAFVGDLMAGGASAADAARALRERLRGGGIVREPAPTSNLVVLLAERDVFAADLAEYCLRTEGFEVVLALDAPESERIFDERQPDVVVLDLMISAGRGLAACRSIAGRGGRVIAVSTLAQRERAVDAGAEVFLSKPIEPLSLVSAIRDVLGTSALARDGSPATHR